jgi:hypothetical protein
MSDDIEAQIPAPPARSSSPNPSTVKNDSVLLHTPTSTSETQLQTDSYQLQQAPHTLLRPRSKEEEEEEEEGSEGSEVQRKQQQFEVSLDADESPLALPLWKKWACVGVVSIGALCVTCASSMVCLFSIFSSTHH